MKHETKLEVLINRVDIHIKVKELAQQIDRDFKGKTPLLIGVLKGSVTFLSDLMRELTVNVKIDFMDVKSYEGMINHEPLLRLDLEQEIEGKDVIIVEDIIDTGVTALSLKEMLLSRNPHSLKICTLLDKPRRRKVEINADYTGFTIPDVFVVGYGLDVNGMYRNLPDIHYVVEQ